MNRRVYVDRNRSGNTDPWWFVLIALSTLILCSCRGLNQDTPPSLTIGNDLSTEISHVADRHESSPAPARWGPVARRQSSAVERTMGPFARQPGPTGPGTPPCPARDCCADGFCLSQPADAPCGHCGETAVHPRDEYLCDGGDASPAVRVDRDWSVRGLATEDTIAHFDTLDGRVEVRASNRVCLYAPRFAATRKVIGVAQRELALEAGGVVDRVAAVGLAETEPPEAIKQQQSTVRQVGLQIGHAVEDRQRGLLVDDVDQLREAASKMLPFEDLQIIRLGVFDASEQVQLTEGMAAAVVWSAVQAPQALLDGKLAASQTRVSQPQETLQYLSEGDAQLRLIKIASRRDAQPGDIVEFTLRFDNVGDEVIGNVTVIDNLTTRLAYVADSQQCSLQAEFLGDANRADSLTLQWQLAEPLEPGQGGIIRFQCRVK